MFCHEKRKKRCPHTGHDESLLPQPAAQTTMSLLKCEVLVSIHVTDTRGVEDALYRGAEKMKAYLCMKSMPVINCYCGAISVLLLRPDYIIGLAISIGKSRFEGMNGTST